MNQHGTLSPYCLDTRKDLLSFLKLCHAKQMSRSFSPKGRNQKLIEVREKHFYFSTFTESAKTYFKTL